MNKIIEPVRKKVSPSKELEKKKEKIANLAFNLVQKVTSNFPEVISSEFGGSYAKGTWLPSEADIDIFVKFQNETKEKSFENIGKKIGFESLKDFHPYIRFSDHPYVEAIIKNTKVNVVPCYDVEKGKWKSAADRSTFHTDFIGKTLSKKEKTEVRILKTFLKNNGLYGSEIAKQGFSGYVCEVLILQFGSFKETLNYFVNFKNSEIIGKSKKKFDSPIVIIDPIDSNRNLGAAISLSNLSNFILLARQFVRNPSTKFFFSKKQSVRKNKKIYQDTLVLKFKCKPRSPDILWGQIKRASNVLSLQFKINDFEVLKNSAIFDNKEMVGLIFLFNSKQITENKLREGPLVFNKNDSQKFIETNFSRSEIIWAGENGRILSLQKRNFNESKKFLEDLLKNNLNKTGIPKGLLGDIKSGYKISNGLEEDNKSIKRALKEILTTNGRIFCPN